MKCQTYGSENPSGARFCGECGTPAKTPASSSVGTQPSVVPTTSERKQPGLDEHYCSSCGEIIKNAAELCPKCGVRLRAAYLLGKSQGDFIKRTESMNLTLLQNVKKLIKDVKDWDPFTEGQNRVFKKYIGSILVQKRLYFAILALVCICGVLIDSL